MGKKLHLHEKLGITFQELGALLGTRAMLARMVLDHNEDDPAEMPEAGEHMFNMNISCKAKDCGTVSCIGGTMALIMGYTGFQVNDYVVNSRFTSPELACIAHSDVLTNMFYPPKNLKVEWQQIRPDQAVEVIDAFLDGYRNLHKVWCDVVGTIEYDDEDSEENAD